MSLTCLEEQHVPRSGIGLMLTWSIHLADMEKLMLPSSGVGRTTVGMVNINLYFTYQGISK